MNKQYLIQILRDLHVLSIAEKIRFGHDVVRYWSANREFARSHPEYAFPPYWLAYDAYSSCNRRWYVRSGLATAQWLNELCTRLNQNQRSPLRICEWGCGPGRVLQPLIQLNSQSQFEIYGSDYARQSIEWCCQNITGGTFVVNRLEPPLPFEDESFDLLFSISVYTHLSEKMHYAWLTENLRVIKPGGHVVLTTQGDNFRHKLREEEVRLYEAGRLVVREKVKEGSRLFVAFQSPAFMRERLLRDLEIILHDNTPNPLIGGQQDIWIVRKT